MSCSYDQYKRGQVPKGGVELHLANEKGGVRTLISYNRWCQVALYLPVSHPALASTSAWTLDADMKEGRNKSLKQPP